MPMLIPNPKSLSKDVTKSGVDIDEVVRNSFSCAVKNSLNKFSRSNVDCITKVNRNNLKLNNENLRLNHIVSSSNIKNKNFKVIVKPSFKRQLQSPLDHNGNMIIKKEKSECYVNTLDDSLTNLQWLSDVKINDILDGKPIPYTPLSPAPSNSSDDGDEKKYIKRENRHYSDSSIDYRTNQNIKPPYSYAALIIMAMKSKACAKMTLSEIYKWITDNFLFYKHADPSWQNSIRHNLSLNKCFAKIPRNKGDPGKGGYWRVVSEFANKLLESNIRKRRSSVIDYSCHDILKRQRLDMFESQLLCKIKPEIKTENESGSLYGSPNSSFTVFSYKSAAHDRSNSHTPIEADLEQCRIDHPYGKNPYVKYNISDEENIKAIANNLQHTSSSVDIGSVSTSIHPDGLSSSQVFNTFSNVIVTDCIWSAQQNQHDGLTESMSKVTEELLEARNYSESDSTLLSKTLANSLNSSGSLLTSPFCLSPPLSGDDDDFSDEFEDTPSVFSDDVNLTVRGTGMTLFQPTPEMVLSQDIKEEPLSPKSLDSEE